MPTHILRPNADVKADWTEDAVGTAFSKLDDAVTQPTAPTTGSDRITTTSNATACTVGFETFTLGSRRIRSVTAWVYGQAVDASNYYTFLVSGVTPLGAYFGASFAWRSTTGYGSLTQAQLDGLELVMTSQGATGTREIDAVYLEVVTENYRPNRIGGRRRLIRNG